MSDSTATGLSGSDPAPADLTWTVSRSEVRRFALAIGATAPVHHDVEAARRAGYRDLLAPAYFFLTMGLSLGRLLPVQQLRADGLAAGDGLSGRVVAAGSDVVLGEPICAGDTVRVEVSELPPETKQGSNGPLTIHTINRTYLVNGRAAVSEAYIRIGY
jgi:acyl dehydratase